MLLRVHMQRARLSTAHSHTSLRALPAMHPAVAKSSRKRGLHHIGRNGCTAPPLLLLLLLLLLSC